MSAIPLPSAAPPSSASIRPPLAGQVPVANAIDALAQPATLYRSLPDHAVMCTACAHRCRIKPRARGICQVRFNVGGVLYAPWGYAAAIHADPVEKKPFYHVLPGSVALTFGMLGCNLHCDYCQNWDISQTLRDAAAGAPPTQVTPAQMVAVAHRLGARSLVSSYNEPLITSEWAVDLFRAAKEAGLMCLYVSNGYATSEVLEYLRPWLNGYKIDLKSMRDKAYRQLGATLQHVLDGIRLVYQMGFWLELVTLVVPGFNDSTEELRDAAQFIRSLSPDIPWHVTAFHPDYRMTDRDHTDARALMRAAEIGYEEGLRYVYAGNVPGCLGRFENTYCPRCSAVLIERIGFRVLSNRLKADGLCPACGTRIAGLWQAPSRP
ncbi:MAG: AmmeMemoRadiSam system radical SAM enzyme [Anaerolineae bacterium]|nr:AmmeMemoRadiSam system radical SAM enzyme [Thermoflexales bacterium]MDW8407450.1 AmmeMemoRadiSam system radical SAM enzyme [Anaerolineae bacterium]